MVEEIINRASQLSGSSSRVYLHESIWLWLSQVASGWAFEGSRHHLVLSEVAFLSSVTFEQHATVVVRLALHQSQRGQSIPTLSVLMGKATEARQLWTQWSNEAHRQTAVCVYESNVALFKVWLTVVAQHNDVRSLVIQKVATLVNQPVEQLAAWLANTSDYQMQLFWQRISPSSGEGSVLRSLLDMLPPSKMSDQQSGDASVIWLKQENSSTVLKHFATVTQLLPQPSVPGLLVLLPDSNDNSATIAALISLTQFVEAVPVIPVGIVLTAAQGKFLLDTLPESRTKALLRNGLIEVPSPEPDNLRQWLGDRGVEDDDRLQPILDLAEKHGTTLESLEDALTLITPTSQPDTIEADITYRSRAERFLFQFLEARPTTTGRFQVNARLDIDFGDRPMEVDFLNAEAKIVIELDGHYHFQSLDNYRRDRRKDRILQQQGFLVLRFLSEDVVRDLEEILKTIDQALTSRQSPVINHLEA